MKMLEIVSNRIVCMSLLLLFDHQLTAIGVISCYSPSLFYRDGSEIILAGGADLGARAPAAGSPHRAGAEDDRAGQRQDPPAPHLFIPFPLLSAPGPYTTALSVRSL